MHLPHKEKIILYLLTFTMGLCGLAYEYTFSKISSDLLGHTTRQWAIVIGVMMFCMGLGANFQKHLSDKSLFEKFMFLEIVLGLLGGYGPLGLVYIFGEAREYFLLVHYALLICVGFCIGLEIPILIRLNEHHTRGLKSNVGNIVTLDYVGGFVGMVVWIWVLLKFFLLTEIGFILGLLNVSVAGFALVHFKHAIWKNRWLSFSVILSSLLLLIGWQQAPEWSAHAEQKLYLDKIVFSKTTEYQHLVLTKRKNGELFFYINGNLQFSSRDEYIYHEMLVHPAMATAPKREKVLILGGGDGMAVREVLKYPEVKEITLVDLDSTVTELARTHPDFIQLNGGALLNHGVRVLEHQTPHQNSRNEVPQTIFLPNHTRLDPSIGNMVTQINIMNVDAIGFLESVTGEFDVILVDFPDPNNLELSKLYSKRFYTYLKQKLSREGRISVQSSSPFAVKEAFLCIGRTLSAAGLAVVPLHENVPSFGEWGWWLGGHEEIVSEQALRSQITSIQNLPYNLRHVTLEQINSSSVFGKTALDTEKKDINTLLKDRVFHYYFSAIKK